MDTKFCILFVALCTFLQKAESLSCYVCNNRDEPKCGVTFELQGSDAKKYIETCEGETVACKKIQSIDSFKETELVTRSCWSANSTDVPKDHFECKKLSQGMSCYCRGSNCNGATTTMTCLSVTTVTLLAVISLLF